MDSSYEASASRSNTVDSRRSIKRWMGAIALLLFILLGVAIWPSRVEPVAWKPSDDPGASIVWKGYGAGATTHIRTLSGLEFILPMGDGSYAAGSSDGRVYRVSADLETAIPLADTGGRPLGMALHPDGRLVIADGVKGLLAISPGESATPQVLLDRINGKSIRFADALVIDREGRYAYLTDASSKWGYGEELFDILEHAGHGQLIRYDFETGQADLIYDGLEFANGIVFSDDESHLILAETGAYRIGRFWLAGEQKGRYEIIADNLPGLPDNLTRGRDGRIWVALFQPRSPILDGLADSPTLRKMVANLLRVFPAPAEHDGRVMAMDESGANPSYWRDQRGEPYTPITTVLEDGERILLGSLSAKGLLSIPGEVFQ